MDPQRPDTVSIWRSPLQAYPDLLPEPGERGVRAGSLAILGTCALLVALLHTIPLNLYGRLAASLLLVGAAVRAIMWLQRPGGLLPAARLLIPVAWLVLTAFGFRHGGVAPAQYAGYPLLLFLSPWVLGVGMSAILHGLSCLAVILPLAVRALGGPAGPLPSSADTTVLLLVMGISVLWAHAAARSLMERHAGLRQLNNRYRENVQRAQAREQNLRQLADNLPGLLFECDTQGRCVYLNQRLARFLGKPVRALLGTPMAQLLSGGSVRDFTVYQATVLRGEAVEFDMRRLAADGAWCDLEVTLMPCVSLDGVRITGWEGLVYDVTRRERVAMELREKATHDALTGLPNRLLFHERLEHALQRAFRHKASVAVMFIDLDNFKLINDQMGHAAGDLFLREVARRITGAVRASDTVARLGGDEFVVLAEDVGTSEQAAVIADKVLEALLQPMQIGEDNKVSSGGSIGIALGPQDGTSGEALLQAADAALYEAKSAGRKCYRIFGSGVGVGAPETSGFSRPVPL